MLNKVVHLLSGEWILNSRPNGGTVIFFRALWVSALVYSAAIVVKVFLSCPARWSEAIPLIGQAARSSFLPFAAGTFAFAYTALYARFASQWSYLANVYNQIMAAKSAARGRSWLDNFQEVGTESEALQKWQAGFIEDAEELHLATKPMFANVIVSMLEKPGVRKWFIEAAPGGVKRLDLLEASVRLAIAREALKF
jgi:hypothetical protein